MVASSAGRHISATLPLAAKDDIKNHVLFIDSNCHVL
jgi:hypothetical protein